MSSTLFRRLRPILLTVLTLLLIGAAFAVRTAVYEREAGQVKKAVGADFVPFMVESAIMYDYAWKVAQGKPIAPADPDLGGMEDVSVSRQMLLGMEYFLGWGYRLKTALVGAPPLTPELQKYEDNPDFSAWIRWQMRLWISTVAGLIFLWLIVMRVRWLPSTLAALAYCIAPAAIARYTGQDLLRGEFCMPFLMTAVVAAAWLRRRVRWYKLLVLFLATLAALACWDAPQMFFAVWAGLVMLLLVWRGRNAAEHKPAIWLTVTAALLAAGILIPYQRYHGLLASPLLPVLLTLLAMFYLLRRTRWGQTPGRRLVWLLGIGAVLTALWLVLPGYGQNYGHFGALVLAKLEFFNVKPIQPERLNFDARILWTPALHSATWNMTKIFYPALLWAGLVGAAGLGCFARGRRQWRRDWMRLVFPLYMTVCFFLLYVFFVRAHVFCVIFLCLLFGAVLHSWLAAWRTSRWQTWLLVLVAVSLVGWEARVSQRLYRDYGSMGLKEVVMLIQWLRAAPVQGMTVLTDMTLSPMLKAYCHVRILTQPQFELKRTRDLVENQIMLMFHGDEAALTDFCRRYRVDVLVFDRGNSYDQPMPIYSSRYMAAARNVNRAAPAWFLEKGTLETVTDGGKTITRKPHYFYPIAPPAELKKLESSFRVFRFVAPGEKAKAEKAAALAEYFLQTGKLTLARKMAAAAYAAAPNSDHAYIAYYHAWNMPPDDPLTCLTQFRNGSYDRTAAATNSVRNSGEKP